MRQANARPWGTRQTSSRGVWFPAGVVLATLLLALPLPPTPVAAAVGTPARVSISEIMADPPEGTSEAQGEWVELLVDEGGDLAGIVLSDGDGDPDFTFPTSSATTGERLIVANGETLPEGTEPLTSVFYARKSWWTFDNGGDDLSVTSSTGELLDYVVYGSGGAVDARDPSFEAWSAEAAAPEGASVGRIGADVLALQPTPGAPNRALGLAGASALSLLAVVASDVLLATVICNDALSTFNPFLWDIAVNGSRSRLPATTLSPGGCALVGTTLAIPLRGAIQAWNDRGELAQIMTKFPQSSPSVELRVLDPYGSPALEANLTGIAEGERGSTTLWTPCACDRGWSGHLLAPVPAIGPERPVRNVSLAAAGPALDAALRSFITSARATLEVNAYLLTSEAVMDELVNSASRGVSLRILVEPSPAGVPFNDTALSAGNLLRLALAGASVRMFNTSGPQPSRDHAKYLIADSQEMLILTENLVEAALREDDPNTGYALRLHSPDLSHDLLRLFEWDFSAGRDLARPLWAQEVQTAPLGPFTADSSASLLTAPNESPLPAWVETVEGALDSVDIEVLSADLSTLGPDAPLGAALVRAAGRGVEVRLLLASSYADPANPDGNLAVAQALLKATAGLPFPISAFLDARDPKSSSKLHAKVLLADNSTFILGSHNLVAVAFLVNREVSLLVRDPKSARTLADHLASDFESAVAIVSKPLELADGLAVGTLQSGARLASGEVSLFASLLLAGGALVAVTHFVGILRTTRRRARNPLRRFSTKRQDSAETGSISGGPEGESMGPPPEPPRARPPAEFSLRASLIPPADKQPLRLPPTALELLEDD